MLSIKPFLPDSDHLSQIGQGLFEIPLSKCRSLEIMGFKLSEDSVHPFVRTSIEILRGLQRYEDSSLRCYYDMVRPQTGAQLVFPVGGKAEAEAAKLDAATKLGGDLTGALELAIPWRRVCGAGIKEKRLSILPKEGRKLGIYLSDESGFFAFGPVADEAGFVEFLRLKNAVLSLKKHGYRPATDSDHIQGWLLENEKGERIVHISGGHHRTAAMVALGYTKTPVVLSPNRVVREEDCLTWPGVVSGEFRPEDAIVLFRRIFTGQAPECCEQFLQAIDQSNNSYGQDQ